MVFKDARFWRVLPDGDVRCQLCNHYCRISDGQRGRCGVRQNISGKLKTLNYGSICAVSVDKIEKKPLYHFYPSSSTYSFSAPGCNFRCDFCQNWSISQINEQLLSEGESILPSQLVENAINSNCRSISYTYTEPTVFYELAEDTAIEASKRGLKNVFVTNGYMSPSVLENDWLDAANFDIKSAKDEFYRERCGAKIMPVLQNVKLAYKLGIWVELTTLLIPGVNDSDNEIREIAEFIAGELSPMVPFHLTAFFPNYKMGNIPAQSSQKISQACQIAKEVGLKYVYPGNVMLERSSYCHNCGRLLVARSGFMTDPDGIVNGHCDLCGHEIPGIFD